MPIIFEDYKPSYVKVIKVKNIEEEKEEEK